VVLVLSGLTSSPQIPLKERNIAPFYKSEKEGLARHQWLMPVILVTQEAEIRKVAV
jgi:hypothetical protein